MGSATTPTTVSIATMPTSMTDAEATRLGLKSYSHGTTYNAGIAPTVTGGSGFSHIGSSFVPYQMQSGSWRLRFNVSFSQTSSTTADIFIAGILALRDSAISVTHNAAETFVFGRSIAASNQLVVRSGSSTSTYSCSGDIDLSAKPTWAY